MATSPQSSSDLPLSAEEARISSTMAQDRPTIDAAVKSFLSLVCARSMTASVTDQDVQSKMLLGIVKPDGNDDSGESSTDGAGNKNNGRPNNQKALQVARAILQSCNAHEFPIHKTVADALRDKPGISEEKKESLVELSVVARLWNGLIQSKQKPTRFLGRKALLHAWPDMDIVSKLSKPVDDSDEAANGIYNQQLAWIKEFEEHLFRKSDSSNSAEDDDAALIWDADGGQAELARRRQRRQSAATERGPTTPS